MAEKVDEEQCPGLAQNRARNKSIISMSCPLFWIQLDANAIVSRKATERSCRDLVP